MTTDIIITAAICIGALIVLTFLLRIILFAMAIGLAVKKRELLDEIEEKDSTSK